MIRVNRSKLFSWLGLLLATPVTITLADTVPADLELTRFSGPEITPCVACLTVSAHGEVYAGVDLNGSLGKGPGKGRIVKLVDRNRDGVADAHTVFADVDNPRGLVVVGTRVYVLHTAFGPDGLATGMNLAVLYDANGDGVADGPLQVLVRNICAAKAINDRGTDHSTNGIRFGIDGWIYIAVGDFGFHEATGTDGRKLTLLGGGIARVRPDGTELEMYTTGTRNIYDVAIDPFMNIFTRGNTNDGGGWNMRFLHHVQTGEYGYPRLFKNFTSEIIPALEDFGGGSGVGALFLSEPSWPKHYNNQPLMADWGRKAIYLHRITVDGPSFTQKIEDFAQISQVTDLDVDPSGQMFVGAWDGAGFRGDAGKGYVSRITPKGWVHRDFPELGSLNLPALIELLVSESASTRFFAQHELLARTAEAAAAKPALVAKIRQTSLSLEARVAALFTFAQIETNPAALLPFASDNALREFALRAATDRLPRLQRATLPLEPFVQALQRGTPRERAVAAVSLGRLGNPQAAAALLAVPFSKPSANDAASFSEKFTIKGNRDARVTLAVKPGEDVRIHLGSTDDPERPVRLGLGDAFFTLANGKKVALDTTLPTSGRVSMADPVPPAPAPAPAAKEASKTGKRTKAEPPAPTLVATGPAPAVYSVPADAVSFSVRAATAPGSGPEDSVDFFVSAGRRGDGPVVWTAPRHATPNSGVVVPHLAAHALTRLGAVEASLAAIGTPSEDLALWALSGLHEEAAADGVIARLKATTAPTQRAKLLTTLARLYQQEAPYDATWWWSTKPDTRGPYYKPVTWSASPRIAAVLEAETAVKASEHAEFLARLNDSHRLGLKKLGTREVQAPTEIAPQVNLAQIAAQQGAVGTTAVEDVILSLAKFQPNHARGEQLLNQQGCIACHAVSPGGPSLGPYMGQIGSIMNTEQIATAILRPSDTISQGFQTVMLTLKDGSVRTGFATETTVDKIVLRDMAGAVTTVATADVKEEKRLPMSMMPDGLANALSLEDFAAMVHYLSSRK